MEEAIYGRRHIGKCIEPEEVEGVEDKPQYLGCHANVLSLLDTKCSGKKQCEVLVPDADLERTEPCRKGLKMFLEVRYTCVEGQLINFTLIMSIHIGGRDYRVVELQTTMQEGPSKVRPYVPFWNNVRVYCTYVREK